MRGIETGKVRIRHEVFTEIARMAYEGGDYAKRLEELPFKIIPGEIGSYRDSLFLERAVVGERLRLAMGLPLRKFSEFSLLSDGVEKALDASASEPGRALAIRATREWGKIAFVGEGGTAKFEPSPDIIHGQKTIYGSWVTSLWRMEDLVERLVRWNIHPDQLITHRFALEDAGEAYALMASGHCGKVAVVFDGTEDKKHV